MGDLPVFLLPGTLCTDAVFTPQLKTLELLAPRVEVIQFTSENSLAEMADRVAMHIPADTGAAIIGFSMGGIVAMELVRRRPELLRKLALLNTNHHGELPRHHEERQRIVQEAKTIGLLPALTNNFLPNYFFQQEEEFVDLVLNMAEELGLACFEAQAAALSGRIDSTETLQSVTCPSLILGGLHDRVCPAKLHREMSQLIKDSTLVLLEECGHFSTLEQAAAVNTALADWYRGN